MAAAKKAKQDPRAKALDEIVRRIHEHNFSWDELHKAMVRGQSKQLFQTVREVIAGREFEYIRFSDYVIAMHDLCGGLPVVKYKDETGSTILTRINAGVVQGYLKRGWPPEDVAADFHIPVEAVREVGRLATLLDYDKSYA